MPDIIPVTVLSGFLGSGKTTLLNHILNQRSGRKFAVIVNDMSEINIDADLVRSEGFDVSRTDEELIELSNGCICCTLRADLIAQVRRLATAGRFDGILIESTGIAEPLPIAASFDFRDADGKSLKDVARLDAMVTVVDASSLLADYTSKDFLRHRSSTLTPDLDRPLVSLLVEQIEFADIILLNKMDVTSEEQLDAVRSVVRSLNADARILETIESRVNVSDILDTQLFDFEAAQKHATWFKELHSFGDHIPETEEYGIGSFVYRARQPFHPERLHNFLKSPLRGVLRTKGFFWLASRPDWVGEVSQAGRYTRFKAAGNWWASVPRNRWPTDAMAAEKIMSKWDSNWGDRRNEIVFIGNQHMHKDQIIRGLDACLIGKTELQPKEWKKLADPFPAWGLAAA